MAYLPFMRLLVLTSQMTANVSLHRSSFRTIECYSCMSLAYQDNWRNLRKVYETPHSFTNRCNEPFKPRGVGTVNCSNICVTLTEPHIQGGIRVGDMYIRGCLDKIVRYGFNRSAIVTHRFHYHDRCRTLKRNQLLISPSEGIDFYGEVHICACYGNRCNGASTIILNSARTIVAVHWLAAILALLASMMMTSL